MHAISVPQPRASLLVHGVVRRETRLAQTPYRGVVAIHAGSKFPPAARALCYQEPYKSLLRRANHEGWRLLPCGFILGTAELVACTSVQEIAWESGIEPDLGPYQAGSWVWDFANAVPFRIPVPAPGRMGLFQISDTLLSSAMVLK